MEKKYTAIVLGKKDIGETDRMYVFYTLENGKIQAVSQGVRKAQSKLASGLENFSLVDLSIMKGRGRGRVAGVIVEESFSALKSNLEALEKVFQATALFDQMVGLEEKDAKVFQLFLDFLHLMNKKEEPRDGYFDLISLGFSFKLLDALGYRLEVERCLFCGDILRAGKNCFDVRSGGVVCGKCSTKSRETFEISDSAIKLIRIFFQKNLSVLERIVIDKKELPRLKMILGGVVEER